MGNSLSQDSQAFLEAATAGDAELLQQQIACEPKLLESVTLVKRRGVLHLAAKQGHPQVISTVLNPLLEAVRQEYHAQLESEQQQQQTVQQQQQQQQPDPPQPSIQSQEQLQHSSTAALASQPEPQGHNDSSQQAAAPTRSAVASDVQLSSFKRLRHTVNARDLYRRTPLIVAAKQGHLECTHLLVDAASNLFAVDREGNTSLHYAALHGHAEVVEYLLQRAADRGLGARFVNKRNLSGFTALHYAVWSCRSGVVVPLLAAGADISAANDRVFDAWVPVPIGSTPLHLAVMRASTPIALLLLQHYALMLTSGPRSRPRPLDPRTLVNLYGMNPAQLAAHRSNRQMAQMLMPSVSLSRVLSVNTPLNTPLRTPRVFGPQSLKSIAAAVVQRSLTQKLDSLEAAHAAQESLAASSICSCSKASAQHSKAHCSIVCVQACGSVESEAGTSAVLPHVSPSSSADVDLIVVQAGPSGTTTPASSRAAGPECAGPEAAASAGQTRSTSAFAGATCSSPACSEGKSVSFNTAADDSDVPSPSTSSSAAAASNAVCCSSPLQHALTNASSSGWYDELCCVCWESEVTAAIEPCMHALCLGCARQLVAASGTSGATCPLCRAYIAGFATVPMSARQQPGKRKKSLMAGAGI